MEPVKVGEMVSTRRIRGVAILDALIAAGLLVIGAVAYYALVPTTAKAEYLARQQSTAVQINNQIIENLLLLRPSDLTAANLIKLNLIDAGQTAPPYTFTKLPMNDGWNFSPRKALPSGTGTMAITTLTNSSKLVKLTISWSSFGGAQSYTTGVILGGHR